jgi:hypothetical protein
LPFKILRYNPQWSIVIIEIFGNLVDGMIRTIEPETAPANALMVAWVSGSPACVVVLPLHGDADVVLDASVHTWFSPSSVVRAQPIIISTIVERAVSGQSPGPEGSTGDFAIGKTNPEMPDMVARAADRWGKTTKRTHSGRRNRRKPPNEATTAG